MTDLNEIIISELHKNKRAKKISRDYEKSKYETNESYRELKLKKRKNEKKITKSYKMNLFWQEDN